MIIVLIGVSGTGKTTIGKLLAKQLDWPFLDGDDFHPEQNIAKMANGTPLEDSDRWPWLEIINKELRQLIETGESAVLACSALKQSYRDKLNPDSANVHFVHLQGDFDTIRARIEQRSNHFMPIKLLRSQFADLEPFSGTQVSVAQTPSAIVKEILHALKLQKQLFSTTLAEGLMFPEAPRWHNGELWFTDQHAHQVMRMQTNGELNEVIATPDLPGGLDWLPDGTPLVVLMTERRVCRIVNGQLDEYADLSKLASFHCNDMLVDGQGNTWVGNFGYDLHGGEAIKPAELIFIPATGSAQIAATQIIFPNGMAITPDGNTLLVAETFASRIRAFSIGPNGQLSKPTLWADLKGAYPDGLCLAHDGSVWVATPNTNQVLQVTEGGKILNRIFTRGRPYACMIGGEDNRQLYICSSETDDPVEAKKLRSGRIETITLPIS